jgi:hypothetical protein
MQLLHITSVTYIHSLTSGLCNTRSVHVPSAWVTMFLANLYHTKAVIDGHHLVVVPVQSIMPPQRPLLVLPAEPFPKPTIRPCPKSRHASISRPRRNVLARIRCTIHGPTLVFKYISNANPTLIIIAVMCYVVDNTCAYGGVVVSKKMSLCNNFLTEVI